MHAGRRFHLREILYWTRRDLLRCLLWAAPPTALYHFCGFTFLSLSWVPVALLGTAVSFLVGFKNNTSYSRLWEARQIYGGIINNSRAFAVMVRDFLRPTAPGAVPELFGRHYAWLTALRYQLREPRAWENMSQPANAEYARLYRIPEHDVPLEQELARYLPAAELAYVLGKKNRATQLMALQSRQLNGLGGVLTEFQLMQLQTAITRFYDLQGQAERIKNFPYPRNFSSITTILLYAFVLLVPFGLLREFDKLGDGTFMAGYSVWVNVPFATLLMWVFLALDRVGDSSVNPFEGSANDVPISSISRTIEIDLRDMLDEAELPAPLTPVNNILM
ncbi:bestrophin family protein [Hymenobacter jeollabukensis]|uniref:Multidrug transporter n=1 Tax=Hymenobacter jeollabukensis TaxID=2025313 RepID=A0A5R8WLW7_9BACT|nr:bestrophin family ion channel [Hymenobacter jeollabukensis]TLM90056.1 multidrug transporter [Hymenobacter jeollabukensis]